MQKGYSQRSLLQAILNAIRLQPEKFTSGNSECKRVNSLPTEKQTTKFSSANFKKISNASYTILRIQRLEGKQCRS